MLEMIFNGKCAQKCDTKVILLSENQAFRDSVYDKFLDKEEAALLHAVLKNAKFAGERGKSVETYAKKAKLIVFGLGEKPKKLDFLHCGGRLAQLLSKSRVAKIWCDGIKGCALDYDEAAYQLALGLELGNYYFDKYFTQKKAEDYPALETVCFDGEKLGAKTTEGFAEFASLANAVRYGRDLVNEPANYLTPEVFAADIERLKYLNLEIEILDEKALKKHDFNLLLDVAKGSVNKPRAAVMVWRGDKKNKDIDTLLVGKGVTYDAGGINIKTGKDLVNMFADMAGAAAVVATMKAIALQKRKINVAAVVGLVENMPSGSAMRPNDVIRSMSGQTVEVINTDGEGRMLLADLLWFGQEKFRPKKVIDIATLTGTVAYALGGQYGGIFSNDDKLAADLIKAGEETDELLWRLPMNKTFDKWIDSDKADMKNVGKNVGDGSQAAAFLQRYIQKGISWAHIDMADMEIAKEGTDLCPKGATGFGIRLLVEYLKNSEKK